MLHRFRRVIIMLLVSTTLGVPQGEAQDARAAGVYGGNCLRLMRS
jgi:hypothetical protein